ncbi:hypothetical protein ACS0TY_008065 [Phlomoides rotata]
MMDYILHQINTLLVDNVYFRRTCPAYHPYILRLYYAVLFWIQCLRAARYAGNLGNEASQTLSFFLDTFPPETLPISSPLLHLFKTLCCSQPEIQTYGMIYPDLPSSPGPDTRRSFMLQTATSHILPNIPGIFALIEHLKSKMCPPNNNMTEYPAKGKHIPVGNSAAVFGHHSFPDPTARSEAEKWALVSSGLQYPCEADKKLHEGFADRINDFEFPITSEKDDLSSYSAFLHMDKSMAWFAQVLDVAITEASFFEGSGTLADCPPFGTASNQIVVGYQAPITVPIAPTCSADPASLFPFAIHLETVSRNLPDRAEAMAAAAQTNVAMFNSHPYYRNIGNTTRHGPFWNIRPIQKSLRDDYSYLSLRGIIYDLIKPKG